MALNTTYQIRLEKDSKGILTLVGSDVMRTLFEEMAEKKELIDAITFCNDVEETFLSRQLKYHDEEIRKHEEAKREIMERLEELKERRELEKECITKERRNMENFWQSLARETLKYSIYVGTWKRADLDPVDVELIFSKVTVGLLLIVLSLAQGGKDAAAYISKFV